MDKNARYQIELKKALDIYILRIPTGLKYRKSAAYWEIEKYDRLKHCLSFCKIKTKERLRLIQMIDSSDQENFTVAESIILNKLNESKTSDLSSQVCEG